MNAAVCATHSNAEGCCRQVIVVASGSSHKPLPDLTPPPPIPAPQPLPLALDHCGIPCKAQHLAACVTVSPTHPHHTTRANIVYLHNHIWSHHVQMHSSGSRQRCMLDRMLERRARHLLPSSRSSLLTTTCWRPKSGSWCAKTARLAVFPAPPCPALPCPACMLVQQHGHAGLTVMVTPPCCAVAICVCTAFQPACKALLCKTFNEQRSSKSADCQWKGSGSIQKQCLCSLQYPNCSANGSGKRQLPCMICLSISAFCT